VVDYSGARINPLQGAGSEEEIANEPRDGLQQRVDFTVQWLENVVNQT